MNALLLSISFALSLPSEARLYAAAGKADITPDLKRETIWLAGYGASGRRASGVHDPLYARALLLSDGARTVALVSVDSIGLFREDVLDLRRRLGWESGGKYLFISATHSHSTPDTMGLWGRFPALSGVDRRYHERLKRRIEGLVRDLSSRMREAELFAARTNVDPNGLCRDSRDPIVLDPELNALEARDLSGKTIATLLRWSCHPVVLTEKNDEVSADYPGALCAKIEKSRGGTCAFFPGSIGGHLIPDTDRAADLKTQFSDVERIGSTLAERALSALRQAERVAVYALSFSSETARLTVDNSRYLLFMPSLAFGHKLLEASGKPLARWKIYALPLRHFLFFPLSERLRPRVDTELSLIRLGAVRILGVPGELFPELALGGYDGSLRFGHPLWSPANPNPPAVSKAPRGPYLRQRLGRHGWVVGLANDEIGYIVPAYDFKVTPTRSMSPEPSGTHYNETNSIGPSAEELLRIGYERLLSR